MVLIVRAARHGLRFSDRLAVQLQAHGPAVRALPQHPAHLDAHRQLVLGVVPRQPVQQRRDVVPVHQGDRPRLLLGEQARRPDECGDLADADVAVGMDPGRRQPPRQQGDQGRGEHPDAAQQRRAEGRAHVAEGDVGDLPLAVPEQGGRLLVRIVSDVARRPEPAHRTVLAGDPKRLLKRLPAFPGGR